MNRIKELREALKITQEAFSEKIGLARNTIANYECGRRDPTNQVYVSICREYNVNDKWLRTGEGEMFKSFENRFATYVSEIDDSDDEFIKSFIEVYMELDESSRQTLKDIARKMAEKYIEKGQN